MSAMQLELPETLRAEIASRLARMGTSEAAWMEAAVREKLAADSQLEYLERRAARGDRRAYERVLAKVPAADPEPGDER